MEENKKIEKGLYKGVTISVKVLDRIIIAGIILLAAVIVISAFLSNI